MGGQVQMIYMDPPYGVNYGSNFQPFVRRRDMNPANRDADMTREPEMVQAYRDTWELGLHSYLSYLRDRLLAARDLLHPSGSLFIQISDQNFHSVRQVADEVFGATNFLVSIFLRKKGSQRGSEIRPVNDYLLWYAYDRDRLKRRFLFDSKLDAADLSDEFEYVEFPDGSTKTTSSLEEDELLEAVRTGAKLYVAEPLTSGGEFRTQLYPVLVEGREFRPPPNNSWKFNEAGMERIVASGRLQVNPKGIRFKKYHTDFPFRALNNLWSDLAGATGKLYVVQTAVKAIQRCILMTTDPGDLVIDPTCGSGTTAYVAEQWGRRWITCDVSRVPLALARQRLLTATFPYFKLRDPAFGLSAGFEYCLQQESENRKGDGFGLIPHVTSTTIANDQLALSEVLVDRPERDYAITRVSGPFAFEATIPAPVDLDGDGVDDAAPDAGSDAAAEVEDYFNRMFETLRKVRRVKLPGGADVEFGDIRLPTRSLVLSAEATVEDAPVGIIFGPENGAVSERLVFEAAREAYAKSMVDLYVLGFAIEPNARQLVEKCLDVTGVHANYVSVAPDVAMGDLLKNQRSSQVFSIAGLPDVSLIKDSDGRYRIQLLGLDTFDPATMETDNMRGEDVPAWFLDTNYNAQGCFIVDQAFFPRTSAWDSLRRELRGTFEDSVWDALSGTISEPFEPGDTGQAAVKVIDDRGNELIVVKSISEAVPA